MKIKRKLKIKLTEKLKMQLREKLKTKLTEQLKMQLREKLTKKVTENLKMKLKVVKKPLIKLQVKDTWEIDRKLNGPKGTKWRLPN